MEIPRAALAKAGFLHEGRQAHRDNWRAPGLGPRTQRTAIQFSSEDVGIDTAVGRARVVDAGGFQLRLAGAADLLVLNLAAAEEPSPRPSKRRRDLLDIVTFVEEYPEAAGELPELQPRVDRLTKTLMSLGRGSRSER